MNIAIVFLRAVVIKSNNNNYYYYYNNQDDIYSAVIMTMVIARVHSVHLMNVEQRQAAADPQTKPSVGLWVRL